MHTLDITLKLSVGRSVSTFWQRADPKLRNHLVQATFNPLPCLRHTQLLAEPPPRTPKKTTESVSETTRILH